MHDVRYTAASCVSLRGELHGTHQNGSRAYAEPPKIKIGFTRSRQEYHDISAECKSPRARTTCKWSPSFFIEFYSTKRGKSM